MLFLLLLLLLLLLREREREREKDLLRAKWRLELGETDIAELNAKNVAASVSWAAVCHPCIPTKLQQDRDIQFIP